MKSSVFTGGRVVKTLILTRRDVERVIEMGDVIRAVENAFRLHALGKTQMPPKVYLNFEKGDLRAMPAYLEGKAGVKWVNSHPENPKRRLPTVMAVIIYSDPLTGFPLAVMDGTLITNYRTGAAGAVASKYLARKDSKVFGFIGCGTQAYTQFMALREIFDLELVKAYDIVEDKAKSFANFCREMGVDAKVCDAREVCKCDVLTTATPSRSPIVRDEWIGEGIHINAIGADAPGKQELDERILLRAKIVVDDLEQAMHGGEINVAVSKGLIGREDIYATIGEIVAGMKRGRVRDDEITVFDSTGLAIQDIAVAGVVYERARELGVGMDIELI